MQLSFSMNENSLIVLLLKLPLFYLWRGNYESFRKFTHSKVN